MNSARNTILKKEVSCYINQTERALSALLPPVRQQIIAALQEEPGQSIFQLANSCGSDVERITAHMNKLIKYQYIYARSVPRGTFYFVNKKRLLKVNRAIDGFFRS